MFLSLFCEGGCPVFISLECERNLGSEASTVPFPHDCEPVTDPFNIKLWFLYMVVEIGTRIIYPLALLVWPFCLSSLFPSIQSESPFLHCFLLYLICIPFIRAQISFLREQSKIKYHPSCLFFLIKTQSQELKSNSVSIMCSPCVHWMSWHDIYHTHKSVSIINDHATFFTHISLFV